MNARGQIFADRGGLFSEIADITCVGGRYHLHFHGARVSLAGYACRVSLSSAHILSFEGADGVLGGSSSLHHVIDAVSVGTGPIFGAFRLGFHLK